MISDELQKKIDKAIRLLQSVQKITPPMSRLNLRIAAVRIVM